MFDNPRKKIINSVITAVAVFMVLLTSCANNSLNRFKAAIDDGYYRTAQAIFEETTDPQFFDEAEYFIRDKADEVLTSYAQGESDYKETAEYLANYESFFDMTDEKLALETISESKKFYWNAKEAENEQDYPLAIQYYNYVSSSDEENYDNALESLEGIKKTIKEDFISELCKYKENLDLEGAVSYEAEISKQYSGLDNLQAIVGQDVIDEAKGIIDEIWVLLLIKDAEGKISTIGTVTLKSSNAIKDARDYYSDLSPEIQERVSNYNDLIAAEEELRKLQIEDIEKAINVIGTVTLSSSDTIKTARKVYNSYSAEIKNAVSNYSVLTDAEKKIEELQISDALKKAEDYVSKGDYVNAIKSLDSSISKYGKNTSLSARRDAYADSYVKETIASAASKYKKYDYNALMAAENVLKTALNVLSNEKKLKDELAYYKELEPVRLLEAQKYWTNEFYETGTQISISGYEYNYTLGVTKGAAGRTGSIHASGTYVLNHQFATITGKYFFNKKYENQTSVNGSLTIKPSVGTEHTYTVKNDATTHSFEVDISGAGEVEISLNLSDKSDGNIYLVYLADVYLWK